MAAAQEPEAAADTQAEALHTAVGLAVEDIAAEEPEADRLAEAALLKSRPVAQFVRTVVVLALLVRRAEQQLAAGWL